MKAGNTTHAVKALEQALAVIDQKISSGSTENPAQTIKHFQKLVDETTKFKSVCHGAIRKCQDATAAFGFLA